MKRHATITKIKYAGARGVPLPRKIEVDIPDDIPNDEVEEYLSDHISNTTGFCHNGFKYTIV